MEKRNILLIYSICFLLIIHESDAQNIIDSVYVFSNRIIFVDNDSAYNYYYSVYNDGRFFFDDESEYCSKGYTKLHFNKKQEPCIEIVEYKELDKVDSVTNYFSNQIDKKTCLFFTFVLNKLSFNRDTETSNLLLVHPLNSSSRNGNYGITNISFYADSVLLTSVHGKSSDKHGLYLYNIEKVVLKRNERRKIEKLVEKLANTKSYSQSHYSMNFNDLKASKDRLMLELSVVDKSNSCYFLSKGAIENRNIEQESVFTPLYTYLDYLNST